MCMCQYDAQASCLCVKTKICNTPAVVCYQDHCVVSTVSGYNNVRETGPNIMWVVCVLQTHCHLRTNENRVRWQFLETHGLTSYSSGQRESVVNWGLEFAQSLLCAVAHRVYCVLLHKEFTVCGYTEFTVCCCTKSLLCAVAQRVYYVPLHRVYCVPLHSLLCAVAQFTVCRCTVYYVLLHSLLCAIAQFTVCCCTKSLLCAVAQSLLCAVAQSLLCAVAQSLLCAVAQFTVCHACSPAAECVQ